MSDLNRHDAVWVAYVAFGIGFDLWRRTKQDDSTLSSRTRARTRNRAGRVVFVGGWAVLTGWLVPHILIPALRTAPEPPDPETLLSWSG